MTVTSTPPGIPSPARLAGWISDRLGGEPAELTDVQLIAGGRSNLTYRLTLSGPGAGRGPDPGAGHGAERVSCRVRAADRTGRLQDQVLHGVRLFQAGRGARGHPRALPVAPAGGEGFEREGRAVPALVTRAHDVLNADAG